MTCGIYKIVNNVNGKLYIGQSVEIDRRWKSHIKLSETQDSHLYRAIRKYGLENFTFSIICEVPESALDQYEISYIKYYETTNPVKGYNKTFGGANGRPTEETQMKMSESQKGKILSDETKMKISESSKGKICSEESKQKISESSKGKILSDETKMKISESRKGENNPMFGKTPSEESKLKMSESKKGKQYSLKQYLYQGNVYNGLQELADFLGIKYKTLSKRIHKKTN